MKQLLCITALLLALTAHAQDTPCDMEQFQQLIENGQISQAKNLLEDCRKIAPDTGFVHFGDGMVAMAAKDSEAAADAFEQAVNREPTNALYHLWLGRAYGEQAGNVNVFKQAILAGKIRQSFETAVYLDPDNADARFDLMMYYLMAPGIAGGSDEKAEELARWLEQNDPVRGCEARFIMASKAEEYEKAADICRQAMKMDPDNPEWAIRAGAILIHTENYTKARSLLKNALDRFPDNTQIRYQLGKVLLTLKTELDTAAACFRTCADSAGDTEMKSWSNYRLGEVYEALNRPSDAIDAYRQALKLNAELKEAKKALKRLS